MIVAKLQDAANYRGLSPLLDRALDCLNEEFFGRVGPAPLRLEGDRLYVSRVELDTLPAEETFYEAHLRYLDIHLVLSGAERIDVAHPEDLSRNSERSNPAGDFYAYDGDSREKQTVILRPGSFLVTFPEDAHRVKMQAEGACHVEKLVFKVLWTE